MKTALILDPDLGFGFWLARGLDQSSYQSFPAKSVADATNLIQELHLEVDLLILNLALPDVAELIEPLRRLNQGLRVVALIGDQPRLPGIAARVDLCCRKPDRSEAKRLEWIGHVEELLPVSLFGATFKNSTLLRKCTGAIVRYAQQRDGGFDGSQRLSSAAIPFWRDWEGRILHDHYRLERYLGSSEHSAVFLTRYGADAQQAVAIRVVLAESVDPEILLPRWDRAAQLSHPGLVRLVDMGSCESGGASLLYLVMEYAEENLAEVLQQRPLTPADTREVLEQVLNALDYIHSRGLVHGRVRPSNILGVADQLKISSDGLRPAGERASAPSNRTVYDPPESIAGVISPGGDLWSLGITLVEALTQRPPLLKRSPHKPPVLPVSLPPMFLDLAQQCLQPNPSRRPTAAGLVEWLRPAPPNEKALRQVAPRSSLRRWRYVVPAAVLGLAGSGVLVLPLHPPSVPIPPARSLPAPIAPPLPVQPLASPALAPAPLLQPGALEPPLTSPLPRQVTQQVVPDVSQQARDTIQGVLEVRVRARVSSSGSVMEATLEMPGPSRYFAKRALEAARRWKFAPLPGVSEGSPEDWILRFDYTKAGTQVSSEHATRVDRS
ncbi:MAG TPA: protein kinase [Terriglobales bacterium]|nr:protein kinase [Terriglobales bacterium]